MTKKHFIALADHIRSSGVHFTDEQLGVLANFLRGENYAFKRERWFAYLRGECGPGGGKIRKVA